jgi:DNA-binding transcriptional regulator GbsR (MarR family)
MTADNLTAAMRDFVEFFGEAGPRWGLPKDACRVHAFLYLSARACTETQIAAALSLSDGELREAVAFLADYQLIENAGGQTWRTSDDPWEAMMGGLEARRRREIPAALEALRQCRERAQADGQTPRTAQRQIARMNQLAEDVAAFDRGTQRLSPRLLRGFLALSGRAARLVGR